LVKITKNDLTLAKQIIKIFTNIVKKNMFNLIFFVNLNYNPIILNNMNKKMIPIISFTTSFHHCDVVLPLPKIISFDNKIIEGILFIFDKNEDDMIYKKITKLYNHPFYKSKNINYIVVDDINKMTKNFQIYSTVIIKNPIFFQYLLNHNITLILIQPNENFYSYYSNLLIPDKEYILWSDDNWELKLDNYTNNKNIKNNLKKWVDKNLSLEKIKDKYFGFLKHLQQNFTKENIIIPVKDNYQLEYNNFFNLLEKNYKELNCWGYRLNPLFRLLNIFETNHNFIPEFIKLALRSLPKFTTIHWITNKRVLLDKTGMILKKNTFNYIVNNVTELNNLTIINNISSLFYIEMEHTTSDFRKWENNFVSTFESMLEFIYKQPLGSIFIIRTYTFREPQMISLIEKFANNFESIKIIINKWFQSFMPFRYLVGINYIKNSNIKPVDINKYDKEYFQIETDSLVNTLQYIKSYENDITLFKNNSYIENWIAKNIN